MARSASHPVRIVMAKVGLDGHDRGLKVISRALRDGGVEVIYLGLRQTPQSVVAAAIQEDADGIGISMLSGAHMTIFPAILRELAARGSSDIALFGGGIMPREDIDSLTGLGVARIFTPGTTLAEIVTWVSTTFGDRSPPGEVGPPE